MNQLAVPILAIGCAKVFPSRSPFLSKVTTAYLTPFCANCGAVFGQRRIYDITNPTVGCGSL